MRLLRWILSALLVVGLTACGTPRKSVFPPTLSIQQLKIQPTGQWQLTLRIQNNSYAGMDFHAINGQWQLAELVPVRLHANFDLDIPTLAGDVLQIDVLPTPAMTQALQAITDKGSAGSISYRISGVTSAKPEQEKAARDFDFSGTDWLSPVPGVPGTFR